MKKLARIVIAVLVLAGLGSAGYWYYANNVVAAGTAAGQDGTYTQVVEVTTGSLSSSLSVVGSLEAVQSADMVFAEMSDTARLLTLQVRAGQVVTTGQVIATIDPAPYRQALDQARSDLQAAEDALAGLQTPPTALSIAQADVAVAAAGQTLEEARANLADLTSPDLTGLEEAVRDARDTLDVLQLEAELAERDSLAASERDLAYAIAWHELHKAQMEELVAANQANLEQIESIAEDEEALAQAHADLAQVRAERELAHQARAVKLAQAQADLADAQETLADARAGGDSLELAQAQLAVREADVALQAAQQDRAELDAGADPTDVAAAQAEVDRLRLAVADAEAALAGTQLVAPFDATILDVYVDAGDAIGSSTAIVTLANLQSLQVVASVDETTIRQVSADQPATVTFDAYPNQAFTGQVLSVPLYGTLQGDVTVYDVPLSLQGVDDLHLLVGMTANVEIQVGQASDALLVPTLALQRSNAGYQVLVPNTIDPIAGEPDTVPVQVGLSDGTYTQIVKGLNPGDRVIVEFDLESETGGGFQMGAGSGVFSSFFGFVGRR